MILKENVVPTHANKVLFFVAPIATLILSFLGWAIIPFGQGLCLADFNLGILYTLALSSLGVIGILFLVKVTNLKWLFKKENLAIKLNKDYKTKKITYRLKRKNLAFISTCSGHLGQKRNYSTNYTTDSTLNKLSFEEFAHWFSGFLDAEGNFFILDLENKFSPLWCLV